MRVSAKNTYRLAGLYEQGLISQWERAWLSPGPLLQYIMKREVDAWPGGLFEIPLMRDELPYAGLKERDTGRKLVP